MLRLLVKFFELRGVAIPREPLRRAMRASVADELGLVEADVIILDVSGSAAHPSIFTSGGMDRRRLQLPAQGLLRRSGADVLVVLSLRVPRDWGVGILQDLRRRVSGASFAQHLLRRFRTRLLGAGGPALPHHARLQVRTQDSAGALTAVHKRNELALLYDGASRRQDVSTSSGFGFSEATVSRFEARDAESESKMLNSAQPSAQSNTMMLAVVGAAVFVLVLLVLVPRRAPSHHPALGLHDTWHGHGMRGRRQQGYARVPSVDGGHYPPHAFRARAPSPAERYDESGNSYASEYEYELERATQSGNEGRDQRDGRIHGRSPDLDAGAARVSDSYSIRECRRRSR